MRFFILFLMLTLVAGAKTKVQPKRSDPTMTPATPLTISPDPGAHLRDRRPRIEMINDAFMAGSRRMQVDGVWVSLQTEGLSNYWRPAKPLAPGRHRVAVGGTDEYGLNVDYRWEFFIDR